MVMDDILVHGRSDSKHDARLEQVLLRCKEKNLKLNPKKLKLKTKQAEYIGHVLTENGLQPDPEKVDAVVNFPTPVDKQELKRFLGMIKQLR